MSVFLFDIDGTLTDLSHRLPFIKGEKKDWDAFFDAAGNDAPHFDTIMVLRALKEAGHSIVLMSGRAERVRFITVEWMRKYRVPFDRLYMRKDKDHRPDNIVKSELFDQYLKDYSNVSPMAVFDDRDQVVEMWRARGLRAYQVANGDF